MSVLLGNYPVPNIGNNWFKIIYFLIFSLSIGSVNGQELSRSEIERKIPAGITKSIPKSIKTTHKFVKKPRIDPPNWWVGMKNPEIELMLHDNNISLCSCNIEDPGIRVLRVNNEESKNYLFVNLHIDPTVLPGEYQIFLTCPDGLKSYIYLLKDRKKNQLTIDAVGPEDVVYLIMPDRFSNGDTSNDHVDHMHQSETDRRRVYFRHGGDIQGVINHLDYLDQLGVTTLWLNPVQTNNQPYESYHGYAITDHYEMDPRFGSLSKYIELSATLQNKNMKLIMDVIPNHIGDRHWWLADIPSASWIHPSEPFVKTSYRATTVLDPYSTEVDKSIFEKGWFDYHMPDLDQSNLHVSNYLIQNYLWWIETTGLDGFRIDTYIYPDRTFIKSMIERIRQEYPDFYMVGETWVHGPGVQSFFQRESQLSGVTDFQMYYAIQESLTQPVGWNSGLLRLYYTLAQDYLYDTPDSNLLFLDNHDVFRYFPSVGSDLNRWKCGIGMLMTLRGIPMIYYGTEILMGSEEHGDGYSRLDFPGGWSTDSISKFNPSGRTIMEEKAFNWIQTLATYRKKNTDLFVNGMFHFVPRDDTYVWGRKGTSKTILCLANFHASKSRKINLLDYIDNLESYPVPNWIIPEFKPVINTDLILQPFEFKMIEFISD